MLEFLAVIAIVAALIAGVMFFVAGYVTWSRNTADHQTFTVLNDALTRYKGEGGSVNALTVGAPVGDVLTAMQTPVNWAGYTHQFLNTGFTYPSRSLWATGTGQQYQFYKVGSYSAQTLSGSTPTSQYPYGQGICSLSNDGHTDYNFGVQSSTGSIAVKDAAGIVTVQDGTWNYDYEPGSNASITFWACLGSGPTPTAPSGTIGIIDLFAGPSGDYSPLSLTSVNASGLTSLTELYCSGNASITGSAASLNALYGGLPTVSSGKLHVNDDGLAATGSNVVIAAEKGWSTDAPSPSQSPSVAPYPGTGGITLTNSGGTYGINNISTTTGIAAYQPAGGAAVMKAANNMTIPACGSVTLWSVNSMGNPSGAITFFGCYGGNLTSLNAGGCSSLGGLTCSENQMTSLTITGCTALQNLNCQDNLLPSLNLTGCGSLTFVNCTDNNLGIITRGGSPAGIYYNPQNAGHTATVQ